MTNFNTNNGGGVEGANPIYKSNSATCVCVCVCVCVYVCVTVCQTLWALDRAINKK